MEPPKVETQVEFIEGETPAEKAEALAKSLIEEKVI
jgi:hypothetical protein